MKERKKSLPWKKSTARKKKKKAETKSPKIERNWRRSLIKNKIKRNVLVLYLLGSPGSIKKVEKGLVNEAQVMGEKFLKRNLKKKREEKIQIQKI